MKLKEKINKEINSHEAFVIMKKLWQSKRYRAIFWLILYFIFFAIVLTSLRSSYQNQPEVSNPTSNLDIVESLKLEEYDYEILLNEESLIKGQVINNTNTFVYKDQNYIIVGDSVYLEKGVDLVKSDLTENSELIIPVNKIMLDKISQYVENKTPEKLEKAIKYSLNMSSLLEGETAEFTVWFYGDTTIEHIDLNFNEFVELKELEYEQYILTIKLGDDNSDNSSR